METTANKNCGMSDELRCSCKQLLARLAENGFEIKCKRCKRVHMFSLDHLRAELIKSEN